MGLTPTVFASAHFKALMWITVFDWQTRDANRKNAKVDGN